MIKVCLLSVILNFSYENLVGESIHYDTSEWSYISVDSGRTWLKEPRNANIIKNTAFERDAKYRGYQCLKRFYSLNAMALSFGDLDDDTQQEMYVENFPDYAVNRYEFDNQLNFVVDSVIPYHLPWILCDINNDGRDEMVCQTGDPGMGGNGYLDVYQWNGNAFIFSQRFTFPGMKIVYVPTTSDINGDSLPEIIFTTGTFGSTSYVRVAQWDADNDSLLLVFTYYLPNAYGVIGVADFDQDGNGEFAVGCDTGYAFFEWENNSIFYRGRISQRRGNCALACDFEGNGDMRLILTSCFYNGSQGEWRSEIYRAVGDDQFILDTVIQICSNWVGNTHGGVGDTDNDGREEALLNFYPYAILFEWNGNGYNSTWFLNQIYETGTIIPYQYPVWDMNLDGYNDWVFCDHRDSFHIYGFDNTSIYEKQVSKKYSLFRVFPNPFYSNVNIVFSEEIQNMEDIQLKVYNITGRNIYATSLSAGSVLPHRNMPFSNGVYFFEITFRKRNSILCDIKKVIKLEK